MWKVLTPLGSQFHRSLSCMISYLGYIEQRHYTLTAKDPKQRSFETLWGSTLWGSTLWGSTLWGSTLSGNRFWIWLRTYTPGVYTLGVYSLGQPILDLARHMPILQKNY